MDGESPRPCVVELTQESLVIDGGEIHVFIDSPIPSIIDKTEGLNPLVRLVIGSLDTDETTVLLMPGKWADEICRLWDVRATRLRVSDYGLGQLYTEHASIRKRSFLMGLFWDLKLLDHSLDRGIRLEDLLAKIQEYDDRALLKNKDLMTQVFEKIQLLSANLPQIRQQTEVFTSMYPYHWIQKDEEWLTSIFGPHIARQMIEREQKQTMNRVRHEIRKSQSHYQRALNMIENSMRPLEQYYDREAMDKHWSSRMKKFAPLAITGAVGIGMTLATGGMGAPMFLAGASGAAISNMMSSFEKNNNFRTTLKRSCQEILSWWTVYRRVIAVAIHEADQFMIEENLRCSKRDRQLIDQLAPEQKKKVLGNIAFKIRKQLCESADFRHEKIYEGSPLNVGALMVELESEYQMQMAENLAQFSQVNASKGELE